MLIYHRTHPLILLRAVGMNPKNYHDNGRGQRSLLLLLITNWQWLKRRLCGTSLGTREGISVILIWGPNRNYLSAFLSFSVCVCGNLGNKKFEQVMQWLWRQRCSVYFVGPKVRELNPTMVDIHSPSICLYFYLFKKCWSKYYTTTFLYWLNLKLKV
jgi:hypothetical protein